MRLHLGILGELASNRSSKLMSQPKPDTERQDESWVVIMGRLLYMILEIVTMFID